MMKNVWFLRALKYLNEISIILTKNICHFFTKISTFCNYFDTDKSAQHVHSREVPSLKSWNYFCKNCVGIRILAFEIPSTCPIEKTVIEQVPHLPDPPPC